MSERLVAINAASSLVARLLNVTIILWMYQYLLARISPEDFAVYPVVMAVMVFAPLFFNMFTGGVSRHMIQAYALGQTRRVGEVLSSIVPLLGIASAAFLLAGLVGAAFVQDILKIPPGMEDDARLMLCLLVLNYALQMAMLPFTTGFDVRQRFVELNIIDVFRDLLQVVLLLVLLVGIGPSVLYVVVARVISDQARLAVVLVRSRRLLPEAHFDLKLFRWETARELVSFGLWTSVGQLAHMIATSAGVLLLNRYGSALDVTVYHLGATAFQQIQGMIVMAAAPLLPAMTAMHSLADRARLSRATLRGARYGLWVSLVVACPLAIYSREVVDLYLGEGFSEGAIVLSLFMVTFIFTQPSTLLPMLAMATARVADYNLGSIASSLIFLFGAGYLVANQDVGAPGVALSLVLVIGASRLVYFWPLQLRLTGVGWRDFVRSVLVRGLVPAVAASVVWATLGTFFPPETWLSLVTLGTIGALVYAAAVLLLCLDGAERTQVIRMVKKIAKRS